jgi:hypothetical protein
MTPTTYEHPVGDLEPPLALTLTQDDGVTPVDLTTAVSVAIAIYTLGSDGIAELTRNGAFVGARTTGRVDLVWQAGDPVFTVATYRVVARIIWAGTRPQTVPSRREDAFTLRVTEPAP